MTTEQEGFRHRAYPARRVMSAESRAPSWAHLWSHPYAFVRVQRRWINSAMQVTNVSNIRRTIIPSPENRKVDGLTNFAQVAISH